ncbi:MAG TPA: transcription termination factor Rho [Candidatus Sulfotelmatobacter sp.]|jgi:transcription termination factor Rho|nr:transcription termination factor Rho [Candidatus Sulfotelmatobacter sp.]
MSDAGPHRPSGFGGGGRRRRRGRRGGGGGGVGLARPHGGGGSQPARQVRLADAPIPDGEPTLETRGVLQVAAEGYGFLRSAVNDFNVEPLDPWVPREIVQSLGLETGVEVEGLAVPGARPGAGPGVARVLRLNGVTPEEYAKRTAFKNLVAEDPTERIRLEFDPAETSTRVVDLIAPIGKGQRCLIVAPPKAGKTVLLQKIAKAITSNHPEIHLIVLLVDERPEEVTDMRRNVRGEVIASSSDELARNHLQVAEIALERAKRLVEIGRDVVVLLDSITRLSRAYNTEQKGSGRVLSGGIDARTMEKPRRFFGAARKAVSGGSLTVIGTALVDTGSRMDEVIFQEFKGTGNTEIVMDRGLFERRIFPAIDISKSGTRKEEKLFSTEEMQKVTLMRRALAPLRPAEAMHLLTARIEKTATNREFLANLLS